MQDVTMEEGCEYDTLSNPNSHLADYETTRNLQLLDACKQGKLQTVRELVERKGADPKTVTEWRYNFDGHGQKTNFSPLHFACDLVPSPSRFKVEGFTEWYVEKIGEPGDEAIKLEVYEPHITCRGGHLDVIKYLILDAKCSPNADNGHGWTPMFSACAYGRLEVVKYLVNNPTVTVKPEGDLTPLEVAQQDKHIEVVLYLLSNVKFSDNVINRIVQRAYWDCQREILIYLAERDLKPTELSDETKQLHCEICKRDFNFIRRRQRCHTCWHVMCGDCTKHKVPITDPSSKPEKVCDKCFDIVSAQRKNEK